MDSTEKLLKELSEARGTIGREDEVRRILVRHLTPLGDICYDRLGSVICKLPGAAERPRIMLAAHMDEVGFLVKSITRDGFLRLHLLGGWMAAALPGQRMMIQTRAGDVSGVVGSRPPHGVPADKRNVAPAFDELYVDIGATSRDDVTAAGIRIGDAVVPMAEFNRMHDAGTYVGKAFDDRVGCALLIETLAAFARKPHPNLLLGVATVQEEPASGEHGAAASVHLVEPDVAIILESGLADDTPEHGENGAIRLGGGPGLAIADDGMLLGTALREWVTETAERGGVPLQPYVLKGGNTDGKAIQQHHGGVPTVSLTVPMRYAHCHSGVMKRVDYDQTFKLLGLLIKGMNRATVTAFTDWNKR